MHCGDSLLIPVGRDEGTTPHLWVIVTEPDPLCAIVPLSTLRFSKDQTVVLRRGEHSFVNHDTSILYMYAKIANVDHLKQQVFEGCALERDPFDARILQLIQDGIFASPFTPRRVQDFCRTQTR